MSLNLKIKKVKESKNLFAGGCRSRENCRREKFVDFKEELTYWIIIDHITTYPFELKIFFSFSPYYSGILFFTNDIILNFGFSANWIATSPEILFSSHHSISSFGIPSTIALPEISVAPV